MSKVRLIDPTMILKRRKLLKMSERTFSKEVSEKGNPKWFSDLKREAALRGSKVIPVSDEILHKMAKTLDCSVGAIQYVYMEPFERKFSDDELLDQLSQMKASPSEQEQKNYANIMELLERMITVRDPKYCGVLDIIVEESERLKVNATLPQGKRMLVEPLYFSRKLQISNPLNRLLRTESGEQLLIDVLAVADDFYKKSLSQDEEMGSAASTLSSLFISFGKWLNNRMTKDAKRIASLYNDERKQKILARLFQMIEEKTNFSGIEKVVSGVYPNPKKREEDYEVAMRGILDQIDGVDNNFANEFITQCSRSVLGYPYEPKK